MKKTNTVYSDFLKLDIRVGEIKSAEILTGSKKLLRLQVDLGPDYGTVQILSGIAEYYKPEKIIGKKYAFIANLEPKQMFGESSNGMIMALNVGDRPFLFTIGGKFQNGTVLC